MDELPALGKIMPDIIGPTFKIFARLLQRNAETIRSVKKETFAYGAHERQQLDVYSPPEPRLVNGRKTVLVFEYGGGLVNGARTLPIADGLCHQNVGAFFALKYGYYVIIADYRLMSHGAKFPSGGEDIALAIEWIYRNPVGSASAPTNLFLMGNSAGGIHLATFLLHPDFAATREKFTEGHNFRLRGVIFQSVPFHFRLARPLRHEVLDAYFGDRDANGPLGLLNSARRHGTPLDFVQSGARVLVLVAELDTEDEIMVPRDDFLKAWVEMSDNDSRCALAVDSMAGHNHVSAFLGLGTGRVHEEAWGHQVGSFCQNISQFALP